MRVKKSGPEGPLFSWTTKQCRVYNAGLMRKLGIIFLLLLSCIPCSSFEIAVGIGVSPAYYLEQFTYQEPFIFNQWYRDGNPFAFKAFLDLTYLQVEAGYRILNGGERGAQGAFLTIFVYGDEPVPVAESWSYLPLSAYLKYPFDLGVVAIIPFFGVEYDVNLAWVDANGNDLKASLSDRERADMDEVWIKGGLGVDIELFGGFSLLPCVSVAGKILNATDLARLEEMKEATTPELEMSHLLAECGLFIRYKF